LFDEDLITTDRPTIIVGLLVRRLIYWFDFIDFWQQEHNKTLFKDRYYLYNRKLSFLVLNGCLVRMMKWHSLYVSNKEHRLWNFMPYTSNAYPVSDYLAIHM